MVEDGTGPGREGESQSQGRNAEAPQQIPARGWKSIFKRTQDDLRNDHLTTVSGGVGLFILMALFPALAALVSIYGLVSDPARIDRQFASIQNVIPGQAYQILSAQVKSIASSKSTAGWGTVLGGYLLPTLLGNIIGGVALVAALNEFQPAFICHPHVRCSYH